MLRAAALAAVSAAGAATAQTCPVDAGDGGDGDGDGDGDGGWSPDPGPALRFDDGACDIDRIGALSADDFAATYELRRPFVLTNATVGWDLGAFTKRALLDNYGGRKVKVGVSKHIVRARGDGYVRIALRDAVAHIGRGAGPADDPVYVFDKEEFLHHAPALTAQIAPPSYFASTPKKWISIGGSLSGTQFHAHAEAWSVQLFGKKRWLLYPPGVMPPRHYPAVSMSTSAWLDAYHGALPAAERPQSCVVGAGELVYVPESWYHATLSIGEGVSVAGQAMSRTELQREWNAGNAAALQRKDPAAALPHYEAVLRLVPTNAWVQFKIADALDDLGRTDEAIAAIERALDLSPSHAESLHKLGVILSRYLADDRRTLERALAAFEAATDVLAVHSVAWSSQASVLRRLGRQKEAAGRERQAARAKAALDAGSLSLPRIGAFL